MARRRGNKKRRDVARDSTGFRRTVKIGAIAAGTVAGGYKFMKSDIGQRVIKSGLTDELIKTGKNFRKDMLNKPKNLRTLKEAYDRNIGKNGEVFKRNLANRDLSKIGDSKISKRILSVRQTKDNLLREMHKDEYANIKREFKQGATKKLKGEKKERVEDIIDALYDKVTKQNVENKTVLSHYKKIKKSGLDDDQVEDLLNSMLKWKEENVVDKETVIKAYGEMGDMLTQERADALLKNKISTRGFKEILKDKDKNVKEKGREFFDRLIDKATGTTALTVKDLDNLGEIDFGKRFSRKYEDGSIEVIDFNREIEAMRRSASYKDVVIDRALRVGYDDDGNKILIDNRATEEAIGNFIDKVKDTLPGKVLLKNFDLGDKHDFAVLHTDTIDPNAILTGATDNRMRDAMIYSDGLLYNITRSDNGVASIDKGSAVEVQEVTGWRKSVVKELMGSNQKALEASDSLLSKVLDLNQDGNFNIKNHFDRIMGKYDDPSWEKNQLILMRNYVNSGVLAEDTTEMKSMLYDSAVTTSTLFNRNITGVSDELLDRIIQTGVLSDEQNKMLEHLLNGSEESMIDFINTAASGQIYNKRLSQMINSVLQDAENMNDIQHMSIKKGRYNPLFGTGIDEQWTRDAVGQFRVEYLKQILLEQAVDNNKNSYMDFVDLVAYNDVQRKSLKDIGMLAAFENYMNIDGPIGKDVDSKFIPFSNESNFSAFVKSDIRLFQSFNDIMNEAISDFSIINKSYMDSINELNMYDEYNDAMFIRKTGFNVKGMLEGINEVLKNKDVDSVKSLGSTTLESFKSIGKELMAGRYDPENISNLTLTAQYSMSRLNYSLSEFGLNLSQESTSSPLATYLNFGLKRILPVAFGLKTLEYMNDESRRFLGSSITEVFARDLSYMDMGARRLAYMTPLGGRINNWAETSVIHEYWFGSNHFDTAEERAEWYENGYSPVRKGRFWSFGSSSEYRGGAITYWQPNYLRRAESNYHDISVYGSSEEKWAHSWMPTPTHPFSPIRAMLNPYWLEKKHLEEGDRPYPLTSKMFSEGTPWGAVLNPTVGEIFKPVRMLPEARLRLGMNGRDSKAVINRINEKLKRGERTNDNLLVVSGTDIRNAEYIPYANPVAGEMNFSIRGGQIYAPGYDFMDSVPNMGEYAPPTGDDYVQLGRGGSRSLVTQSDNVLGYEMLDGMTGYNTMDPTEQIGKDIISGINSALKRHRAGGRVRSAGVTNNTSNSAFIYRNLVNEYNNYIDNYYGERYDPRMINNSRMYDYMRDAMYSSSQISGIYGYLAGMYMGSDSSFTFRYENAGQMSTFSRGFWDASIGGIGQGPMEIARRFFPSEQRNRINVNPLINNMPDWIPDSYHTGDPYTKIPKGEMRLPGKGYEAMYDLHPDQFGDYGAFDRFKILADIAPNSKEYKKWRAIAKGTVTDKALQSEIRNITERTTKMSGNHEFFEYKYLKNGTTYSKGVVKEVRGGKIILADDTVLSLAGVEATDDTDSAIYSYLTPGQEITYRHDKNRAYDKENKDSSIASVVYSTRKGILPNSGQSVNSMLINSGAALKDVEDNSVIAQLGRISPGQEASGAVQEIIAHAPIPIIHNKFLRVESAYESYMKENYYGSNFKTWDHPIKGFISPMFNEQSGKSLLSEALSLGVGYMHFSKFVYSTGVASIKGIPVKEKTLSNLLLVTTNPTAFLGGNLMYILNMSNGGSGNNELSNWQKGAKAGLVAGTVKYAWDNADNPFKSTAGMAAAGLMVASRDMGWEVIESITGKMTKGKGAAIGAAIGLTMSMIKNPDFDKEKMFGKWAPKNTRKKWELDEYFDRLEYMKYSGLYTRAAKMARRKEKVDIEGIFEQIDKNKEKIAKLDRKAAKLVNKINTSTDKYARKLKEIENRKRVLEEQSMMMFEGGEWTKSAIAYKKAMESTMYGLDPTATKDELLASVPDQYKDHFQAFMNVTDEKERKKILKSVSPMMRRPLQAAWGMKLERVQSNRRYFKVHALPGFGWRGWKPNVNLKHVKMKTIQNEGMLLSEFGYYDSEKSKVTFEDAPDITNYERGRGHMFHSANVRAILKGHGLHLRNVSVETTRAPGVKVVGEVRENVENYADAGAYKASKLAYHLGTLF